MRAPAFNLALEILDCIQKYVLLPCGQPCCVVQWPALLCSSVASPVVKCSGQPYCVVQWPALLFSAVVSFVLKVQWPALLCSAAASPVM